MCWGRGEKPVLWVAYGNGSLIAWTESGAFNRELTNEAGNSVSHISWHCGADPNSGNWTFQFLLNNRIITNHVFQNFF